MNGGGRYRFQVIDTNRMQIRRCLSMHWRLRNMRRLSCRTPAYLTVSLCGAVGTNTGGVQLKGVVCRLIFEWRRHAKRKI